MKSMVASALRAAALVWLAWLAAGATAAGAAAAAVGLVAQALLRSGAPLGQ